MKKFVLSISMFCAALIFALGVSAQQKDFSGKWKLDEANSTGLPPGMKQEMTVLQDGNTIKIETKIITNKGEQVVPDAYSLDGKETDYDSKFPGVVEGTGKRISKWTEKGFEVVEKTDVNTPQGKATIEMKRTWEMSADGKTLVIEIEAKGPQGEQTIKRTFIKA